MVFPPWLRQVSRQSGLFSLPPLDLEAFGLAAAATADGHLLRRGLRPTRPTGKRPGTWWTLDVKKTCETYGKHPRNLENSWDFTFDFTGNVVGMSQVWGLTLLTRLMDGFMEGLSSVGDIVDDLDCGTTITVTITWGIQLQNNNIAEWWSWLKSMGCGPLQIWSL